MSSQSIPPFRRCNICKEEKPLTSDYFHRDKRDTYGFVYKCKECAKAVSRQWCTDNSERNKQYCNTRYREKKDTYQEYRRSHAEEIAVQKRDWRRNNPEKVKAHKSESQRRNRASANARNRKWARNNTDKTKVFFHRRLARKRSLPNTLTAEQWTQALEYFGYCCAVCGRPQGFWHTLAMDHWIPLSSPDCPGTVAKNVVPLCHGEGGCNNKKCKQLPTEWLTAEFGKRKAQAIIKRIEAYFDELAD